MKKRESKPEAYTANPFEYAFVSLPVENRVNEGEYPAIGLVSYAFEGAMWDIIEGDAMNVEDASSAFEEYLKNYLAQQAAE